MPTPRPRFLNRGDEIGGYVIEGVLGVGGMAVVYRAHQRSLRRTVALKVLNADLANDPTSRERFLREGEDAANLEHPHIVAIHDRGEDDGVVFLVMRFVDGDTAAERMRGAGLTFTETTALVTAVASALDFAHARDVLHRDVTPRNLLYAGDHVFLADFGIAKAAGRRELTRTGGFVGSWHYASPEQMAARPLTTATDQFSLALVALEALTGRPAYDAESEAGLMEARLAAEPPNLVDVPDADLAAVLRRALATEPGDRWPSCGAFATAYAAAATSLPELAARRPADPETTTASGGDPAHEATPSTAEFPLEHGSRPIGTTTLDAPAPQGRPTIHDPLDRPASPAPAAESGAPRHRSRRTVAIVGGASATAVLAVALGIALVLGGDGKPAAPTRLSAAAYRQSADALCTGFSGVVEQVAQVVSTSGDTYAALRNAELAKYDGAQRLLNGLRALRPPTELAAAHADLIRQEDAVNRTRQQLASLYHDGGPGPAADLIQADRKKTLTPRIATLTAQLELPECTAALAPGTAPAVAAG